MCFSLYESAARFTYNYNFISSTDSLSSLKHAVIAEIIPENNKAREDIFKRVSRFSNEEGIESS